MSKPDEPTPTTQQVMNAYVGSPYWTRRLGKQAAFLRWLNAEKAKVWDEAFDVGTRGQHDPNPHR